MRAAYATPLSCRGVAAATHAYCSTAGGTLSFAIRTSPEPPRTSYRRDTLREHVERGFELELQVQGSCGLLGKGWDALGHALTEEMVNQQIEQHTTNYVGTGSGANGDPLPRLRLRPLWLIRADGARYDASSPIWLALTLSTGDRIGVAIGAQAVTALRRIDGLRATAEAASEELGPRMRLRCLHQATLSAASPLVGLELHEAAAHPSLDHAALWAVRHAYHAPLLTSTAGNADMFKSIGNLLSLRNPQGSSARSRRQPSVRELLRGAGPAEGSSARVGMGQHARSERLSVDAPPASLDGQSRILRAGDILLLEAESSFADHHRASAHYSCVTIVPGSMPPPGPGNRLHVALSLGALAVLLGVSATGGMSLLPLSLLLSFLLVSVGCITLEQAWRSIKYRVLLTIACSFGLGNALKNTGVSAMLASALMHVGEVGGPLVMIFTVFFVTSLLSCLISNAAVSERPNAHRPF